MMDHAQKFFRLEDLQCVSQALTMVFSPPMLRIGPARLRYNYTRLSKDHYQCERGSDWAPNGWTLHLLLAFGSWVALDVPPDASTAADVMLVGVPIFRSNSNVLEEGWHEWETNYGAHVSRQNWRATNLRFPTVHLTMTSL